VEGNAVAVGGQPVRRLREEGLDVFEVLLDVVGHFGISVSEGDRETTGRSPRESS